MQMYKTTIVQTLKECKAEDMGFGGFEGLECNYQASHIYNLLNQFSKQVEQQTNMSYDFLSTYSKDCYSYNTWCHDRSLVTLAEDCHPKLNDREEYKMFCRNNTFWESLPCPSMTTAAGVEKYSRCRGNTPGKCFKEDCSCREPSCTALGCPDNSEHICPVEHSFCGNQFMWTCLDNKTCVHHSLRCDGYQHCQDGSDESNQFCNYCPRSFGYPIKNREIATYRCIHRYTGRQICSVPCNDKDDMCKDMEDENCDEKYYVATALSLVGIAAISIGIFFFTQKFMKIRNRIARLEMVGRSDSIIDKLFSMIARFIFHDIKQAKKVKAKCFRKILKIYKKAHSSPTFSSSLKLVMMLIQTLEETHQREASLLIEKIELTLHRGDKLDKLKCIKETLGTNQITMKFFENLEPLGLLHAIKQKIIPTKMNEVKDSKNFTLIKIIVQGFLLIMGYYSDFVKDIIFLFILSSFVPWSTTPFSSFPFQIIFILFFSLINPQILNIVSITGNEDLRMSKPLKLILCICSPFAPAVVVVMKLNAEYLQTCIRFRLTKHYFSSLEKRMISTNTDSAQLLEAEKCAEKWKQLFVQITRNDNNFEHFSQVVVLVLLVALLFTQTATVGGLQDLFTTGSDSIFLIVLSAVWSTKSLVTGHLAQWVGRKNGFVAMKGKILLSTYFILCIMSRLLAFLLYLAPSMGLLNLLGHWKMGSIPFVDGKSPLIYDVEIVESELKKTNLQSVWRPLTDYSDLTGNSLQMIYLGLIIFFTIHWALIALIRRNTLKLLTPTGRFLYILNTLVCPPQCLEWDEFKERQGSFGENWQKTKLDILSIHALYFSEHVLLCLPIFILNSKISVRNSFHTNWFSILQMERTSTQVAALLGAAPAAFAILTCLQVALLYLYYKVGHPWQGIWNLEQNRTSKKMGYLVTDNSDESQEALLVR
eukprot:GFUD01030481.1.p1 GENE.GFUD01030481.1~~GFUD01030481.1.p1  ORF type:complete len:932 (-),score=145.52 GFUD01030481.1:109-2904(-)